MSHFFSNAITIPFHSLLFPVEVDTAEGRRLIGNIIEHSYSIQLGTADQNTDEVRSEVKPSFHESKIVKFNNSENSNYSTIFSVLDEGSRFVLYLWQIGMKKLEENMNSYQKRLIRSSLTLPHGQELDNMMKTREL